MPTPLPTAGSKLSKAPPTAQQHHPPPPHVMAGPSPYLNVPNSQQTLGAPSKQATFINAQEQHPPPPHVMAGPSPYLNDPNSQHVQQQPTNQLQYESEAHPGPSNKEQPFPEEPERMITKRPGERADANSMSWHETHSLSRRVTRKVHSIDLGRMWDNVREVDRRGNIDQQMYDDLIAFFFGFVPMVLNTQPRDPCVVTASELLTYRELIRRFEKARYMKERTPRGPNRRHEWYTRPAERGFLARLLK